MAQRKHTRCSQCGFKVMARWLEVMWRSESSGPWHCVAGWYCAADLSGITGFISGLGVDQLVGD